MNSIWIFCFFWIFCINPTGIFLSTITISLGNYYKLTQEQMFAGLSPQSPLPPQRSIQSSKSLPGPTVMTDLHTHFQNALPSTPMAAASTHKRNSSGNEPKSPSLAPTKPMVTPVYKGNMKKTKVGMKTPMIGASLSCDHWTEFSLYYFFTALSYIKSLYDE